MGVLQFFIAWANAPFTVAGGIAIAFALLQASGLLGLIAGGDHEADADHDLDHDVDAAHDAGGDSEGDHDGGAQHAMLGALGVGRLPFSLIWQTYALVFAMTGLGLNARFGAAVSGVPLVSLAWTLPASLAAGYGAVALLAKVLGPVFSSKKEEATSRAQLVGSLGVVISSSVSRAFGEVRIRDRSGHDLRVVCKLSEGARAPKEHERVVVVEIDASGALLVAPIDDAAAELPEHDASEEAPAASERRAR